MIREIPFTAAVVKVNMPIAVLNFGRGRENRIPSTKGRTSGVGLEETRNMNHFLDDMFAGGCETLRGDLGSERKIFRIHEISF